MRLQSWMFVSLLAGTSAVSTNVHESRRVRESRMTSLTDGQVVTGRFTGAAGSRPWRLFIPSTLNQSTPRTMLVMLHGCTQNAEDFARGTRMDVIAEEQGFLVLYPEQAPEANPRGCWNWFSPEHQRRGAGEPDILSALIGDVGAQYRADPARVHVIGVSAGAAMAGLLAVAYPHQFASLSMASGMSWLAASDVPSALNVMRGGAGASVATAQQMITAMGTDARAIPTLVLHGDNDAVVNARNADESAAQWVAIHKELRRDTGRPTLVTEVNAAARTEHEYHVQEQSWRDDRGLDVVTVVHIRELGHAWSGGSPSGTFTDEKGPDASRMIAAFCARHPTVSLSPHR